MNPTGPHGTPRKRPAAMAALAEAREALAAGRVPAGAEPFVKWWRGDSQYLGGRGAAPAGLWTSRLPDDALRCVCEHLAPTSPPNFEAEDVVDESQEYCDEVVCDLRTLGEEALDDITSRLDDYSLSLSVQTVLRWPYARAKDITTRRFTTNQRETAPTPRPRRPAGRARSRRRRAARDLLAL